MSKLHKTFIETMSTQGHPARWKNLKFYLAEFRRRTASLKPRKPNLSHEPLVRSIHFSLFWRLSIAGLVISTILSLFVYFSERANVTRLLIERAQQVTGRFNEQIEDLFENDNKPQRSDILQRLKILSVASNVKNDQGQLVYAAVYDGSGVEIGTVADEDHPNIEAVKLFLDGFTKHNLVHRKDRHESVQISGAPYVILQSTLIDARGDPKGYIEEAFAVSVQERKNIEKRTFRMILAVFVIVLTTTLAVYPVINPLVNQLLKMANNLLISNLEILQVLGSAIAKRDRSTDRHNFRVTIYAVRLAEAVNLSGDKICSLIKGAFLHDVGKIGIPDHILLKPGKLSDVEFEEMKNHVQHGMEIVKRSDWLKDAEDVVIHHHERYGGKGYPQGIGGRAIPITARIFSIVDVFDALTSKRPYKESMSCVEALRWIKEKSASYFDPALVVAFVAIAEGIYNEIGGADAATLNSKLERILNRYFINRMHS